MATLRTIVRSTFVLSALTLGEINGQQQHIRRVEQSYGKATRDVRQLQVVENTQQEEFLPTTNSRRNGLGRNFLKKKESKANGRNNLTKYVKQTKLEIKQNIPTAIAEDREQPNDLTTDSRVPIISSPPSAEPSTSTVPTVSLMPSVMDLEEANSENATTGRLGDDETTTSDRDRLGSPTRADPNERDNISDGTSEAESAPTDVITGRVENENKDDLKIGAPTRFTDRDDIVSSTPDSIVDGEIASTNVTTGRFIDESQIDETKEDNRIGFPSRSTDRDVLAPGISNSTSLPDVDEDSSNEITGRVSTEDKNTNRIGNPTRFTNRTEVVESVAESNFLNF